jgi:hypothetical protein
MQIFAMCMSCQVELGHPSFEPFVVPYYEDRIAHIKCSRGHETILILQSQKFEVLLESGANALSAGFTLEAAATFSAALERFFEFASKVMLIHKGMSNAIYEQMFKEMARQSERQIGSFIALHALVFKQPFIPNKAIVPFRNSVIHKGEIPTPEKVEEFCSNVYSEIYRVAELLRQHCKEDIMTVVHEDLQTRQGKLPQDIRISTASNFGLYSLASTENKSNFQDAYQAYRQQKEGIEQSLPHLKSLHESLFPNSPDI